MIIIGGKNIIIKKGDLTEEATDAIVNPANSYLKHGGGATWAIVNKGGSIIQKESDDIVSENGPIPIGQAVITESGSLPCKYVIHAIGPKNGEGNEPEKLRQTVLSALELANKKMLTSISMPAISSGIYGFPKPLCAKILIETAAEFLKQDDLYLTTVVMCNDDYKTYNIFLEEEESYINKLRLQPLSHAHRSLDKTSQINNKQNKIPH